MLDALHCRDLAKMYRASANTPSCSAKKAAVLRNLSNSLTAASHQYEMLDNIEAAEQHVVPEKLV